MRIAVFHNAPGGVKRAVYEMVKGLSLRGHDLVEVVPSTAEVKWFSLERYIVARETFPLEWPVWRRRIPFLTPYLHMATNLVGALQYHRLSQQMAAWLESQSFDVLFANDCSIMLTPPIVGYSRIPSLLYVHHGSHLSCDSVDASSASARTFTEQMKEYWFRPAIILWNRPRYRSERWSAQSASAVACNSTLAKQLIRQAYHLDSRVIHYGVDADTFSPNGEPRAGDYVLSVGSITPHKAFEFIVRSLGSISVQARPSLVIASAHAEPEELARLKTLAQTCGVNLRIVHPQSDQELANLYRGAKVFVFAAHREAFGLVVLEAMACGTPVVGVQDGGYSDAIIPGVTGCLTPRSPQSFGEAVAKLLESAALRRDMGRHSRESVVRYWTWERTTDDLEAYLLSVSR